MSSAPLAYGLVDTVVIVVVAIVLFVVVITVTAVLMGLLQAVLPRGDTEAEELHRREFEGDAQEPAGGSGASHIGHGSER